jgi:hypothetical protein
MRRSAQEQPGSPPRQEITISRALLTVAAAWFLSLGVDLFLHGAVLARFYNEPAPFLLEPAEAFRRVPLGYLAFLILTAALYWLIRRLDVGGARDGARVGAIAGGVIWGALSLGLYSISTIDPSLAVGWWIGQTIELGLAGAVLGAAAGGASLRRLAAVVMLVVAACLVATIVLQSIGWAPATKIN